MSLMSHDDEDFSWPDDAVEVGRIGEAYGIKGWFHVLPYAADPQALFSTKRWYLLAPELPPSAAVVGPKRTATAGATGAAVSRWPRLMRISQAKEHGDGIVASAQGVEDRAGAEALRGARIHVPRSSFPTAGDGEYYWVDLIGLDVVNREGQTLGQVTRLMDNGAQSLLCVVRPVSANSPDSGATNRTERPKELLIPFVDAFVDGVDLAARRISVDWGEDY
ncbi:MAG: ribosome maturation factor RimM [Pseudomonadota bacterium]|jgi:16S rRNA processing protein RimM